MGRRKRPHAPGMVFHLVSRLHRREPLFVPKLRGEVSALIQEMIGRTDAQLLGFAVMPNHLHIVLRQGSSRLGSVMQPLMRRVAQRVKVRYGLEGSIVERRYRDRLCETADHVREVLLYVHLNPWRAGLCDDDLDYRWTTHEAYRPGSDARAFGIDPGAQLSILGLFAQSEGRSRDELCEDYLRWLRWRMMRDLSRKCTGETDDRARIPGPDPGPGDRAWRRYFGPVARSSDVRREQALPDLRDFVRAQLSMERPTYKLDDLRGSWLPRAAARCRARVIRRAANRGYRTGRIADLFDIRPSTVSTARYAGRPRGR